MSDWGGGYVTDIAYTRGYYVAQSPHMLALACLLNGVAVDLPADNPHLHYLELGCGRGTNACVLAAANPGWRVTAIDFNPAAIADARRLAAAAGIDNVVFMEADLASFIDSAEGIALPPADVVSLHGVWSWVSDAVRAGILRLLGAKVRAGGVVHISYNALPALQGTLAVQRLLRETGMALSSRSDRQVVAGREVVKALAATEALNLRSTPMARDLVERLDTLSVAYLAHEYMNAAWQPFFHADVARSLGSVKLEYAGSVRLFENFVDMMLTPAQKEVLERFDDPLVRELVIDTCTTRTLRHDVYVRGVTRLSSEERDAALGAVRLALIVDPAEFGYEVEVPAGQASLNEAFYRPIVAALAEKPMSIAELLARPEVGGRRDNPAEMLAMLVGTHRATIVAHPDLGPDDRIRRYNALVARRDASVATLNEPSAMTSLRLGAGLPCRSVEMFLVERIGAAGGMIDPRALAMDMEPTLSEEDQGKLADVFTRVLKDRLAVWQAIGVL